MPRPPAAPARPAAAGNSSGLPVSAVVAGSGDGQHLVEEGGLERPSLRLGESACRPRRLRLITAAPRRIANSMPADQVGDREASVGRGPDRDQLGCARHALSARAVAVERRDQPAHERAVSHRVPHVSAAGRCVEVRARPGPRARDGSRRDRCRSPRPRASNRRRPLPAPRLARTSSYAHVYFIPVLRGRPRRRGPRQRSASGRARCRPHAGRRAATPRRAAPEGTVAASTPIVVNSSGSAPSRRTFAARAVEVGVRACAHQHPFTGARARRCSPAHRVWRPPRRSPALAAAAAPPRCSRRAGSDSGPGVARPHAPHPCGGLRGRCEERSRTEEGREHGSSHGSS